MTGADSTVVAAIRILVPTDFSPMSKLALRATYRFMRLSEAELHLLHVVPEYAGEYAFHIHLPGRAEIERQAREWARRSFNDYLRGEECGQAVLQTEVRFGDPARVICAYAEEKDMSAIVMASHGRSGFDRAVFGSTAEKVLRLCRQPVMIVKGC